MKLRAQALRNRKVVIPAALAALGSASLVGYAVVGPRDSGPARLYQQTASALDEYLNRSPGERDEEALLKGKGKGSAKGKSGAMASREVPAGGPEQQALGKIFEAPGAEPEALPGTESPVAETPLADALAANETPSVLAPGGFLPSAPGGGGGGTIGGGGGGGGGGGVDPPPPPGPVPEPSTWALMILGFFFSGFAMRRRARHLHVPAGI